MEFPVASRSVLAVAVCMAVTCLAEPYHRRAASYYVPAPIGHDGRVVDTPEVAQAKAAHLAAFSKLSVRSPQVGHYHAPGQDHHYAAAATAPAAYGHYSNPGHFSSRIQHGHYGYRGPPAPLAHDGRVVDTPEVAQAKAAHFAAFNHAAVSTPYNHHHHDDGRDSGAYHGEDDDGSGSSEGHYEAHGTPYQGPPAPLAQDGRVIDTPEVAHAKAAHLAALQQASHGAVHTPYNTGHYNGDY